MTILRRAGLMAVMAGAVGSVGLTLYTGRGNSSRFLMILFVLWVLAPFLGLALADRISKQWAVVTRATLYCVMLVLTVGPLAIYADVAFGPPRAQTAFAFLVVPLVSWLMMAVVVPTAAWILGRRTK